MELFFRDIIEFNTDDDYFDKMGILRRNESLINKISYNLGNLTTASVLIYSILNYGI